MKFQLFPGIVFVLLGGNVAIVGTTIYFATRDPSVAVEPDYYQKAVHWDATRLRAAASRELGWSASIEPAPADDASQSPRVILTLTDRAGVAVDRASVRAEVFHHARSGDRSMVSARPLGDGRYALDLPSSRAGLWQFRVEATRGADEFACTIDRGIGGASAARSSP